MDNIKILEVKQSIFASNDEQAEALRIAKAPEPARAAARLKLNDAVQTVIAEGLDLLEIPYSSGSDANSALVGGHCDLYVCGWDDIAGLVESGDIVPILALCEKRMSIAPDLQCSVENGIDSVMGPWRGIFAKKGTPQEAIDTLVAAIEEAKQSDTWKEFTHNAAYDERPIPAPGEETAEFCHNEYKDLHDYMVEQGTLVKDYDDLK